MGGQSRGSFALTLALGAVIALGAGCDRIGGGPGVEEREANYIAGQNFRIQHQPEKAIASFEQAVLVNPSNAAAHLALADLFFLQESYINSAYHYSRHQQLLQRRGQKPDSTVAGRLEACELQLALKYSQQLSRQQTDSEVEALRRQLAERDGAIRRLQTELLQRSAVNPGGTAVSNFMAEGAPPIRAESAAPLDPSGAGGAAPPSRSAEAPRATSPDRPRTTSPTAARTHVVRAGETPAAIARRYGVSTGALLAANPGLNPTRMKIGTVLRVPTARSAN